MLLTRHFRKYYLKYALSFLIGGAVLVAVAWLQLEIPGLIGRIIDHLKAPSPDTIAIEAAITQIAILALMIAMGRFAWRYTIFGASRKVEFDLRNVMFNHASNLSQNFFNNKKVGGLMTYFINDLQAVRMAFGPGILMLIDGLVLGGIALSKMANLNAELTLYTALPMFSLTVVMVIIRKKISNIFKQRQESVERLSDFTQENFSGIAVIKAFVREVKEKLFFKKHNVDLYDKNMKFVKYMLIVQMLVSFAVNIVILLIVVFGSFLVINQGQQAGLTAGQLTEFISYFLALLWPVMALSRFVQIYGQAKASANRIGEFLDHEVEIMDKDDALFIDDIAGSISIRNLSFQYPDGETPVLKNISFDIKKGEMVGILGRTGSGKSSLVDLLLRIYNLEEDKVFLGGYDIMKLSLESVRNTIGYVPQDNFLFSDTIENNIGFSFEYSNEETIRQSAKLADVYDNISEFRDQFSTMLGERGVTVSGGQKQRISIARALAKDPEILILDDSVSAVDTKTEEAIIDNLHRVRKGRTTIFITHRISTVKKMDKIILLDEGNIVAIGSHLELIKTSPLYQDMVKRQELERLIEGGAVDERL